jgi:beta-ribofuranosylaminobenzene 5'-phosphate synthase
MDPRELTEAADAPPKNAGARSATVESAARLHLGFLDPSGRGARGFGSLGVALDRPVTALTLSRAPAISVTGPEAPRAERHLRALAQACGIAPDFALHIRSAIPAHAGLGSGTQLALSVGAAFAAVTGAPLGARQIAGALGRGRRSGIGIGAFETGGALLDGGRGPDTDVPPILSRLAFPETWRIVMIFDPEFAGMHGDEEHSAFSELPPYPEDETADLCRRLMLSALPALAEENLAAFSLETRHLQRRMGDYFAPAQGARFSSPAVAETLARIEALGIQGVGQSSWGPTGFALVGSQSDAEALVAAVAPAAPSTLRFEIARGRNSGSVTERHE